MELNAETLRRAAPLMLAALDAHAAWAAAERDGLGTSFGQRCELSNYAEWMTRKARATAQGADFSEDYNGVPHLIVWPVCELQRAPEADVAEMVQSILAHRTSAI